MAYSGWLVKVGNYTIETKRFVKKETYNAYVNMQDLDPWTDANGYVHRTAVELKAMKIEFETPFLLQNDFNELMRNIRANYTVPRARQFLLTAYIPEYDEYMTQTGYLADFTPQIYGNYGGVIRYNPMRLAFIGGVYDG